MSLKYVITGIFVGPFGNLRRIIRIQLCDMSLAASGELRVIHDTVNREFYITFGKEKAVLQYNIINQTTGAVDLQHTEVPPALRGKGIGKLLAKEALDYFASKNTPFKLTCWYLQKYYDENQKPEYVDKFMQ